MLRQADRVLILTHQYPDGDTLGSGFALCHALQSMGKQARVLCEDPVPPKYDYMSLKIPAQDFEPGFICAVDVATREMLGALDTYAGAIDLAVDHHGTHKPYASHVLLDASAPATATLIYDLIGAIGAARDLTVAECIYTGLSTDTGCFKYENTTPEAHRLAAELIEAGARYEMINRLMFDMKSRQRIELERLALQGMRFFFGGRCAVMTVTNEMLERIGTCENDMEGLAPIPRQIEGVWVGVTLREKPDGAYKVSMRTDEHADAAAICAGLGGGGHIRAAGCTVPGPADSAAETILRALEETVTGINDIIEISEQA
jgi:phosphoesterase RecJ-like protein